MIKKLINSYYNIFDNKLEKHNSIVIMIISLMVLSVWFIVPNKWEANYVKSDISQSNVQIVDKIIIIDGVRYRLVLDN